MDIQNSIQSTLVAQTASFEGPVSLTMLPEAARFNLRIAPENLKPASKAFGVSLPKMIGTTATVNSRVALCVGPDEWVLWSEASDSAAIETAYAALYDVTPHSLTDLSDREITIVIEGARALELLSVGCPRDLSKLSPGFGTRTIFDYAQAVLICESENRYRLDIWRSFLPHVWGLLNIANQELATGY